MQVLLLLLILDTQYGYFSSVNTILYCCCKESQWVDTYVGNVLICFVAESLIEIINTTLLPVH